MGWVLAFLLFLTVGLLAVFLLNVRGERDVLLARVAELEPAAARSTPLQSERDKLADAYEGLRKQAQEIAAADAEKGRLLAKCEAARGMLKAERDKFAAAYSTVAGRMRRSLRRRRNTRALKKSVRLNWHRWSLDWFHSA